jgi:hypothetical protein
MSEAITVDAARLPLLLGELRLPTIGVHHRRTVAAVYRARRSRGLAGRQAAGHAG